MINLLAMPPGEIACSAAILLVTGPVLVGVDGEAAMLLVVGPGLTGGVEKSFDVLLDFEGACATALLELEATTPPFLFLSTRK